MKIHVTDVLVDAEKRRKTRPDKVKAIADSIAEIGLLNPITVDPHFNLIAGLHRLEAHKGLGLAEIECTVLDVDPLLAELAQIDENLARADLKKIEEDVALAQRKRVYEKLYPETKAGQAQAIGMNRALGYDVADNLSTTFAQDAAEKTGDSERTVRRHTAVGERLEMFADLIRGTPIEDNQSELQRLAKLDNAEIVDVLEVIRSGEADSVAQASGSLVENKPDQPHVTHNSGNNEWYTPPEYIEAARQVMGNIDLDPASSEIANKTVQAATFYTQEDDGLLYDWACGTCWMNPPYASHLIGLFANKLAEHVKRGDVSEACVLVNNATETAWFNALLDLASCVCFIRGRVKFIDMDGKASGAPLQGQAVLYIGPNAEAFGKAFSDFGRTLYARRDPE